MDQGRCRGEHSPISSSRTSNSAKSAAMAMNEKIRREAVKTRDRAGRRVHGPRKLFFSEMLLSLGFSPVCRCCQLNVLSLPVLLSCLRGGTSQSDVLQVCAALEAWRCEGLEFCGLLHGQGVHWWLGKAVKRRLMHHHVSSDQLPTFATCVLTIPSTSMWVLVSVLPEAFIIILILS